MVIERDGAVFIICIILFSIQSAYDWRRNWRITKSFRMVLQVGKEGNRDEKVSGSINRLKSQARPLNRPGLGRKNNL